MCRLYENGNEIIALATPIRGGIKKKRNTPRTCHTHLGKNWVAIKIGLLLGKDFWKWLSVIFERLSEEKTLKTYFYISRKINKIFISLTK